MPYKSKAAKLAWRRSARGRASARRSYVKYVKTPSGRAWRKRQSAKGLNIMQGGGSRPPWFNGWGKRPDWF